MSTKIKDLKGLPEWKIALSLNYNVSDTASRGTISKEFDKHQETLKNMCDLKKLAGVVSFANSLMLDFETALKYSLTEENSKSLLRLQESSLLYGRFGVVGALDKYGKENGVEELIMNENDYQEFLVHHALPQFRLYKVEDKEAYSLETDHYKDLMSRINISETAALKKALRLLDNSNNDNIARKFLFATILKDQRLIKKYQKELKSKFSTQRRSIDRIVLERAVLLEEGTIKKLQTGDYNRLFPLASHIYLVEGKTKKIWKENIPLYTNFSRLDGYSQEKALLESLDHPNIIKLLGSFTEENMEFLELEHAPGQSIDKYSKLEEHEILQIGITLCDVVDYLHSKNIVYMDMKDTNVMYDREAALKDGSVKEHLKLLDFGMSQKADRALNDGMVFTTLLSTPKYITPELAGFRAYKSTDVFQLGILLYELLYKKHPFAAEEFRFKGGDENRESEVMMYGLAVTFGDYKSTNDSYDSLFSEMFEKDPLKRPSISYVRKELQKRYDSITKISDTTIDDYIKEEPEVNKKSIQKERFIWEGSR